MPDLLFFLILGHYVGDFALQTDHMAQFKPKSRLVLTSHVTVYTVTLMAFLWLGLTLIGDDRFFTLTTLGVAVFVFVEHWVQDLMKGSKFGNGKQGFFVDQAIHLVVIYLMRVVVYVSH